MRRREALAALVSGLAAPWLRRAALAAALASDPPDFQAIERRSGGRLGVAVLDARSGRRLGYRADERFPMCSTFKWLLAAEVLSRVEAGEERLDRRLSYTERDLLDYAPITRAHAGDGAMTIAELIAAAIQYSDNTAANLLLTTVGGPASLTAYLRGIGDPVTRLDRTEPTLNSAEPGDPRDTTTPRAMVADLDALLVQGALSASSRDRLVAWMKGNTTGAEKLRAGLPSRWAIGDKTGMGGHGSTNDVAIVWPAPDRPLLVAAYLTDTEAGEADRNAALADVARTIAAWLTATG